jgi:hypothetical protein
MVTVTGTSGSLTKSATIAVTVTAAPSFTISAAPANVSVATGATATSAINVELHNGFTGKVSLTASGLPSGVTASFSATTITFSAAGSAAAGNTNITVTGTSGALTNTTSINLAVLPRADYSLSAAPSSLSVVQGTTGAGVIRIVPTNGFSGTVSLTASGLPSGVTATFSSAGVSGQSIAAFTVFSTAAKGTSTVTIAGMSGTLGHTTSFSLTILSPAPSTALVNLSSVYNVSAVAVDGLPFAGGGLDAGGRSYSGTLLGASQTIGGVTFGIAPMNSPDAVAMKTVPLPAGVFSALKMLATGVNGNQPAQSFTVNYSDGTKSTFTQSLSDWYTPQNYTGEVKAVSTGYRDNSTGTTEGSAFNLYEYSFNLAAGKTVSSVVLPNNRNVVTLTGGSLSQAKQ